MTTEQRKPHLSATQIGMYCRCPEQYRRRYIEGEILPPGIALLKGSGFHRGAEHNFRQKVESHQDLPSADIVDAAVAAFESALGGAYALTDDEQSRGAKVVLSEAKDDLAEMATVHAEEQAPDYQPVMVEEVIRIPLPGERDMLGVIDLADDKNRVIDLKTAARKKTEKEADESVQLTIYAAAYRQLTGRRPSEVRLDTVIRTKTGKMSRQVLSSSRRDADFSALAHRITAVSAAVTAGIFTPAEPGHWMCAPRWCGFYSTCKFVNSETRAMEV